jgi:hypothetical protein
MNQRIKELEAQCWEPKQYGPPWFNSQKFAELIVAECISALDIDDGATHHSELLLEHFGVAE